MNKNNFIIIFLFLLNTHLFAQVKYLDSKWINHTSSAITFPVRDMYFISKDTGFIINDYELLTTFDRGNTWQVKQKVRGSKSIDFEGKIGCIATVHGNILLTKDSGSTWEEMEINDGNSRFIKVDVISADTIILASRKDVYFTADGGLTWRESPVGSILDMQFISSKTGLVICSDGVFKTVDGAVTWEKVLSIEVSFQMVHNYTEAYNYRLIQMVDDTLGYVFENEDKFLKTIDGGTTWSYVDGEYTLKDKIWFYNETNGIALFEDEIYNTNNGGETWEQNDFSFSTSYIFNGIYMIDDSLTFVTVSNGIILKSADNGWTWKVISNVVDTDDSLSYVSLGDFYQNKLEFTNDTVAYIFADRIYKTTNSCKEWQVLNTEIIDSIGDVISYSSVYLSGVDTLIVNVRYQNHFEIIKSVDGGQTFDRLIINENQNDLYSAYFYNSKIGFVSCFSQFSDYTFRTLDGGNTWEKINDEGFRFVRFFNDTSGYAFDSDLILRKTDDAGLTWHDSLIINGRFYGFQIVNDSVWYSSDNSDMYTSRSSGVEWNTIYDDSFDNYFFITNNIGYAISSGSIYETQDGGNYWVNLESPISVINFEIQGDRIYIIGSNGIIMSKEIEYRDIVFVENPLMGTDFPLTDSFQVIVASNFYPVENITFDYNHVATDEMRKSVYDIEASLTHLAPHSIDTIYLPFDTLEYNISNYRFYVADAKATIDGYDTIVRQMASFSINPEIYVGLNVESSYTDALLKGGVETFNQDILNIEFQYGKDSLFENILIPEVDSVALGVVFEDHQKVVNLDPETQYYARIKFEYKGRVEYSEVTPFHTLSDYVFMLGQDYLPNGSNVELQLKVYVYKDTLKDIILEYGLLGEYSESIAVDPNVIEKNNVSYYLYTLENVNPDSIYNFRLKGVDSLGTVVSQTGYFRTAQNVNLFILSIDSISSSSLKIRGGISLNKYVNGGHNVFLEYRKENEDWHSTDTLLKDAQDSWNIECEIGNLEAGNVYYFRVRSDRYDTVYYSNEYMYEVKEEPQINPTSEINTAYFKTYPNPVKSVVVIQSLNDIDKVKLLNVMGSVLQEIENVNEIDVTGYPSGLYFLEILSQGKIIKTEIVVE